MAPLHWRLATSAGASSIGKVNRSQPGRPANHAKGREGGGQQIGLSLNRSIAVLCKSQSLWDFPPITPNAQKTQRRTAAELWMCEMGLLPQLKSASSEESAFVLRSISLAGSWLVVPSAPLKRKKLGRTPQVPCTKERQKPYGDPGRALVGSASVSRVPEFQIKPCFGLLVRPATNDDRP